MEILLQALDIFLERKFWSELKPSEVLKILLFTQGKGWLYTPTINGKVQCILCAYRISEVTEQALLKLPMEESGTILYVPFFISLNESADIYKTIRESLKIYIEQNPDVTELVLEDKNDKVKRYSLKGEPDEKTETRVTISSNV